jgi:hypothetical protein
MVFRDPAAAHRRLKELFPQWTPPRSPEHACWLMVQKIMNHPKIDQETKLYYWNACPPEAYAWRNK